MTAFFSLPFEKPPMASKSSFFPPPPDFLPPPELEVDGREGAFGGGGADGDE